MTGSERSRRSTASTGKVVWRCVCSQALCVRVSRDMLAEIMRPGSSTSRGTRRLTRCSVKVPSAICRLKQEMRKHDRSFRRKFDEKCHPPAAALNGLWVFGDGGAWFCAICIRRIPQFPIRPWLRGLSKSGYFKERNHRSYLYSYNKTN
jgi:hypothetical protein